MSKKRRNKVIERMATLMTAVVLYVMSGSAVDAGRERDEFPRSVVGGSVAAALEQLDGEAFSGKRRPVQRRSDQRRRSGIDPASLGRPEDRSVGFPPLGMGSIDDGSAVDFSRCGGGASTPSYTTLQGSWTSGSPHVRSDKREAKK